MNTTRTNYAKGWAICALAALFYCYEFLLRIEPSVMVTELMHTFQVNATTLGLLSAVYYFIYTPMQIVVGILSDLYGPRKILIVAISACTLGSYIFGIAPTIMVAASGRLLIGFGSAFAFIAVLKLAVSWLPPRFFSLIVGLTTTLGMLGAMSGNIVLSSLVTKLGWQTTINIGTLLGVILLPLIWLLIYDQPKTATPQNSGAPLLSYRETLQGFWQILKNPQMWLIGSVGCITYSSLALFAELWGNPFLTTVYHISNHQAATATSMVFLGWLIGGPLLGYISAKTQARKILLTLGCLGAALTISIVIYCPQYLTLTTLYFLLLLFGICASTEILCFTISSEHNAKKLVATATAFTNSLVMLSGSICQPLIGKILDLTWSGEMLHGDRIYSIANNQLALTILPLIFLLGCVLTFWLNDSPNKIDK